MSDPERLTYRLSAADKVDTVRCPACNASPGDPCTAPTTTGRVKVSWVHDARRDLAQGWA